MEAQIKEEASLCVVDVETPDQDLSELSIVEKYDRFLLNDNLDPDSDGEIFPDDSVLKKEYALLRNEPSQYSQTKREHRLSTGLPSLHRRSFGQEPTQSGDERSGSSFVTELIQNLNEVRKCEPDGNSVFCTESELEAIQEKYTEILDFLYEKSSTFEKIKEPVEDNDGETEINNTEKGEDMLLLSNKMESVQQARDKFYEVEQQVREHIEQLELVERYKMESVG